MLFRPAIEGDSLVSLLRPVRAADDPKMFARANARTAALLAKLEVHDTSGWNGALGDSAVSIRSEYIDEWKALVATFGPLKGYEILGSVREGQGVVVYAWLKLRDGDEVMTFRWSQLGSGRLAGTRPRPQQRFPLVLPVARASNGELVIHDLWRQQERARLRPLDGGRLRLSITADSSGRSAMLTAPVRRVGLLRP